MTKRSDKPILDAELVFALSDGSRPAELGALQRDSLRERIMRSVDVAPPAGTYTMRANEGEWRHVSPLVLIKTLRLDRANNSQTVLIRLLPGGEVVGHRHSQEEECLVIEGEVQIGEHSVYRGDMHIAGAGSVHAPIRSKTGALLMIRSEIPPEGFRIAPDH